MEPVEWCYDGLGGKVIQWTHQHGSDHEDPSILAFLVGVDGTVESSLMNGGQYQASGFATWLEEGVKAYEKAHPQTRLPFVLADVTTPGETPRCQALEAAHEGGNHVLLFFGRDRIDPEAKGTKKEVKRTRSFAKKVLDSKNAEKEADGFVFLRFDVAGEDHAAYAKQLGVEEVPTLLIWSPGAETPTNLGRKISAYALAAAMKKAKTPAEDTAK